MNPNSLFRIEMLLNCLFVAALPNFAVAQVVLEPRMQGALPYCGVLANDRSSFPGQHVFMPNTITHAMRKADGGLIGVPVTDGIGCDVSVKNEGGKLIAHVTARRVTVEPLEFDSDHVLVRAPKEKVDVWEKSVDLTVQDRVEFGSIETKLGFTVVVGVQRID